MKKHNDTLSLTGTFIFFTIATVFFLYPGQPPASGSGDQDESRPPGEYREPGTARYIEGQLIVKVKGDSLLSEIRDVLPVRSFEPVFRHLAQLSDGTKPRVLERGLDRVYVIAFDTAVSVESALEKYKNHPEVEYIQPNYIYEPDAVPDDPLYNQQYAHQLTGAASAWDINTGAGDVVVAVVGTGVDIDHTDLAANIWSNPGEVPGNGVDDDGNGFILPGS